MADRTVASRDALLNVRIDGDGPPFVWGHPLLGSVAQDDAGGLFTWEDARAVATVIRYDARGHGHSAPVGGPDSYRWPSLAADMLAVADAVAPGPVVLGGASMGCGTALHAACAMPERVTGLVLVIPPTAWATRRAQARRYAFAARVVDVAGGAPLAMVARLLPHPPVLTGDLARVHLATVAHLGRLDRKAAAAALRGASRSDLPPPDELRRLRAPALVLTWTGDRNHPVSTAETLAKLLPAADLHVAATAAEVGAWPGLVRGFLAS